MEWNSQLGPDASVKSNIWRSSTNCLEALVKWRHAPYCSYQARTQRESEETVDTEASNVVMEGYLDKLPVVCIIANYLSIFWHLKGMKKPTLLKKWQKRYFRVSWGVPKYEPYLTMLTGSRRGAILLSRPSQHAGSGLCETARVRCCV